MSRETFRIFKQTVAALTEAVEELSSYGEGIRDDFYITILQEANDEILAIENPRNLTEVQHNSII